MALIICAECGGKVSDKAIACPHCGCPVACDIPLPPNPTSPPPKRAKKKTQRECKQELVEIKRKVGVDLKGRRIMRSFYGTTRREALSKYEAFKEAQKEGRFYGGNDNFAAWADYWLEHIIKGTVKSNTFSHNYEIPLRLHILPYFGQASMNDIKPVDIQQFFDTMLKSQSVGSVQKMRVCLVGIFDTAVDNGLCFRNPVTRTTRVKGRQFGKSDQGEREAPANAKRAYTPEQFKLVAEYAKTHLNGLPILLLLYTGISRSELLGIHVEDITTEKTLLVRHAVTEVKNQHTQKYEIVVSSRLKNAYRERAIPLPGWLYDCVTENMAHDNPLLFHNQKGGPHNPNNWTKRVFQAFMQDMHEHYLSQGVDVPMLNVHELRHTAASKWAWDGVSLYTIAKLGGWTDLKMLAKVYGHPDTTVMRKELGFDTNEG